MKLRLTAILSLLSLLAFGQEDGVTARLGSLKGNDRVVTNAAAFVTIGTVEEIIDGKMGDYVTEEDFEYAITNLETLVSNTVPKGVVQADIGYVVSTNETEITTNLVYSITNKMVVASSDLEIKDGTNTVSIGAFIEANSVDPSNMTPLMDGVASVGESNLYARADHVHPGETVVSNVVVLTTYASLILIDPLTGEETTNETEVVSTTTWTNNIVYVRDVRVVPYDSVLTSDGLIKPNLITTSAVTNKAITGWKIADQTMRDANFSEDSIQGYRLRKNSVAGAANNTSTSTATGQLAYNTVGTVNLRDEAVTTEKLAQQVQDLIAAFTTWTNGLSLAAGEGSLDTNNNIAFGARAAYSGPGLYSVGIGTEVEPQGDSSVVIGPFSRSLGLYSIAIGDLSTAHTTGSLALGYYASAGSNPPGGEAAHSIAIGSDAQASAEGACQLGYGQNEDDYSLQFRSTKIVDSNGDLVMPSTINMHSGSIYFGDNDTSYISERNIDFPDADMSVGSLSATSSLQSPSFSSSSDSTEIYGSLNIYSGSGGGMVYGSIPFEISDRVVADTIGSERLFFTDSSYGSWYRLDVNSDGDPIVISGESPYDY